MKYSLTISRALMTGSSAIFLSATVASWNQSPYGVLRWARSAVDFLLAGACLRQEFEL